MSYNLGRIEPEERPGLYAVPPDDAPPARSHRVLAVGGALLVMGLFAGGLWFAYVAGLRHSSESANAGDIPLIRADARPIKVRPVNPGGMAIPDRNMLIYNDSEPAVEHLLPPPEQPMPRPGPLPPPVAPAMPAAVASPQTAGIGGISPVEPTAIPVAATTAAATGPVFLRRGRPDESEKKPAEVSPAKPRDVRLQLGSVRSEASAREEWDRIRRDNPDLLGGLSAVAVRADLGNRGVYFRIQTGPVADAARADRICGELRQRHLGCIIVR